MTSNERVAALRAELERAEVDLYLVPSADAHQSEYVPEAWRRRAWLSGFTGSAGDCVVGREGAWLWTDSRYWLQAGAELDAGLWTLMKDGADDVPKLEKWLGTLAEGTRLGCDPRLLGMAQVKKIRRALEEIGGALVEVEDNLIDRIWTDQPALPAGLAGIWPEELAGRSVVDKLGDIREQLGKKGAGALVVTTLDAIAWTFNLRGSDVAFNPVVIAYALVGEGAATLFVAPNKLDEAARAQLSAAGVEIAPYEAFGEALSALSGKVWIDDEHASLWVKGRLLAAGCRVIAERSPIMMMKATKNDAERAGMRACHLRDAAAVCRFLHWLEGAWQGGGLDEIAASDRLEAFRAEGERFAGLSFDTISAFGANGAIVHYSATPETSKVIDGSSLYLVDSGGQYLDGTTDITRTVHLGTPTAAEREHYTRVLRGHLALRHARFPKGTTGTQIDMLARAPLWEVGLDYGHGTGHGVGCYLSVHQGPQRISPRPNKVGLVPGMVVSNEPGYYLTDRYGIRIENLCLVAERDAGEGGRPFYGLEDLTMVPYCRKLIDAELLDPRERAWVDAYHDEVRAALKGRLPDEVAAWLERETAPLG